MEELVALLVSLGVGLWIFLLIMSIIWLLLPFAIFGIKKRLNIIISLLERNTPRFVDPKSLVARIQEEDEVARSKEEKKDNQKWEG